MRLHESQNFHFHNVHNNSPVDERQDHARIQRVSPALARTLRDHQLYSISIEIHLQLIGNLMRIVNCESISVHGVSEKSMNFIILSENKIVQ